MKTSLRKLYRELAEEIVKQFEKVQSASNKGINFAKYCVENSGFRDKKEIDEIVNQIETQTDFEEIWINYEDLDQDLKQIEFNNKHGVETIGFLLSFKNGLFNVMEDHTGNTKQIGLDDFNTIQSKITAIDLVNEIIEKEKKVKDTVL